MTEIKTVKELRQKGEDICSKDLWERDIFNRNVLSGMGVFRVIFFWLRGKVGKRGGALTV